MEEIIKLDSVKEAEQAIKKGYTLYSYPDKKLTYFKDKDHKVLVVNDTSSFILEYAEWRELYKYIPYAIYHNDEDEIDISRDQEYYSWGKLSK